MRFPRSLRALGTLRRARDEHWREGWFWLGFTILGGLLPLWGGATFLWVLSSDLSPSGFVDHGEFAIYSAGLLAPALFVVVREYKAPFPERAGWALFTVALLIVALLFFAAATAPGAAPTAGFEINRAALRVLTPILYLASLCLAFALTVIREALAAEPRLDELSSTGRLEDKFDTLQR